MSQLVDQGFNPAIMIDDSKEEQKAIANVRASGHMAQALFLLCNWHWWDAQSPRILKLQSDQLRSLLVKELKTIERARSREALDQAFSELRATATQIHDENDRAIFAHFVNKFNDGKACVPPALS